MLPPPPCSRPHHTAPRTVCANLVAAYLHGNEQDKRRLLLTRAIQWGMWFIAMSFVGGKSIGGEWRQTDGSASPHVVR